LDNEFPKQNTGLIDTPPSATDWIAGAIPYELRNPTGDWRPYLPMNEKQKDPTETMGCVSFSANNSLEVQTRHQTGTEVNYSDRFMAKMSGTTKEGNWLSKVADTVRNVGVVLESVYPKPANYSWETYYSEVPQDIIAKAIKLDVMYEFLPIRQTPLDKGTLSYHLKHAPLQVAIPAPHPNHAVLLVHLENETAYYFDTYDPFLKTTHYSSITSALKYVLTIKKNNMFLANDKGTVYVITGNRDKRKIGLDSLASLGLFGDEPQIPMDTTGIPNYNTIVGGKTITSK